MVSNVTSLTGNGLKDWLIQRATAVYVGLYTLFLLGFILMNPTLDYGQWTHLFHCHGVQIASAIAMFSLILHAWIGLWTVTTDYLKHTWLRVMLQLLIFFFLLSQLIWFLMIMWGHA